MDRLPAAAFLAVAFTGLLPAQLTTHLSPEADRGFDSYIRALEAKFDWQPRLVIDKPGVTIIPGATPSSIDQNGAIIHDWLGAVLSPGTTTEKVIELLQSYDDYPRLYAPQITASRVYSHDGNLWRIYLQLHKKKLMTANLATDYEVEYRPLGQGRWAVLSHSTKVAELDGGRELPVGQGHGFLWRLNAYWLIEQRSEGVYIECRAISMSRDVPIGLGWIMRPMVTSVPRESLQDTLESTVRALQ